jgi:ribosome-associated toxin RatA of RatAB toxin-antitoxin module
MHTGRLLGASLVLLLSNPLGCPDAMAIENGSNSGKTQATSSLFIKASPHVVWKAVHDQRNEDPDIAYSKLTDDSNGTKLLEQQFLNIPMLGTVTAVTRQVEDPDNRIDYTLVKSDKFKALNGCWEFTPVKDGTMLRLSSTLDIGVPFSNFFIKMTAQKTLKHRLAHVKQIAETEQARIAQRP